MAAPGRIRRSIRFAQLDAGTEAVTRETPLRRERMRTPDRLEIPSYEHVQDWTEGMGISPSGRFQVVEDTKPRQGIFGETGIRMDWARLILWILLAVLTVVLLVEFAEIGASSLQVQKLRTRINAAEARGKTLKADLAASSGDISILTKAVEMNLISSGGAQTIQLTAPAAATMNLVTNEPVTPTSEPVMMASAGHGE